MDVQIIKDYHQGFLLQGYGDNVPEEDKARIVGELRHQWSLSSQEFDFDAPTVELYQSEKYSGVIFIAYDTKTHRGVMRQCLSLMGGS